MDEPPGGRRREVPPPSPARERSPICARSLVALAAKIMLVTLSESCVEVDPALSAPCAARAPGEVEIGTGADAFEPLSGSVEVQLGPQGGGHVWFALRCRNLGPRVQIAYGVRDLATGMSLSQPGLRAVVDLVYEPRVKADEMAGLYGYLTDFFEVPGPGGSAGDTVLRVEDLAGRSIALWAKVEDACGAPVRAEARAVIGGYEVSPR